MSLTPPSSHGGGAPESGPFKANPTGFSPIMVDSPDGDPSLGFDADAAKIDSFYTWDFGNQSAVNINVLSANEVDTTGLSERIQMVAVQAGAPDPIDTYAGTPLVFDSTAVTGGLYGWDGSQYQQVGGPL